MVEIRVMVSVGKKNVSLDFFFFSLLENEIALKQERKSKAIIPDGTFL